MGLRTWAFDALEFVDDLIEGLADHQFVDTLGIARATPNRLNLENRFTIVGDDHLARADVLRAIMKRLFHTVSRTI